MALDKQYAIYGIDTSAFYFADEKAVEQKMYVLRGRKGRYKDIIARGFDNMAVEYVVKSKYKQVSDELARLKEVLIEMMNGNMKRTRVLDPKRLNEHNRISVFGSELTRCLNMVPLNFNVRQPLGNTTVNEQMMVVSVFFFEILENLVHRGFVYNRIKYVYYASSAGQIRTKKAVFVREDMLKQNWNTLTCGLTIDKINAKGGQNLNKYNAYLALSNSATDVWEGFDIDRCIVVDNFETNVVTEVDYVDNRDYSITRQTMPVPIPHTDGAGMISPELSSKNFMVRLPWIKGLLGVFPFKKFIQEKGCSSKVVDIWGKEWDIFEDNIQVIFTKSQLKMADYYDSWDEYKTLFKQYGCHAGVCNVEDEYFKKASINYQMIQSFVDYTDDELRKMCANSVSFIENICKDKDTQFELFGISLHKRINQYSGMQKCLVEYNGLIKDSYFREQLRDFRKKLIKDLYSAKFRVNGYYTFLLPDFYAMCEWLFQGVGVPTGLLKEGEVHCKLHIFGEEVDCLRSPHLYFEHSIQTNITSSEIEKWFLTNGCYTSTHDVISKVLMFDVDGDKALVVQDDTIIKVAKRNQKGIVPLYYNMRKAFKEIIGCDSRYRGLAVAFTGGNIGMYSNNISKIKNSKEIQDPKTKQEALDCLRWLCMMNNEVIDFAKCLYKSTPPRQVKDIISKYTNRKLPAFFKYAKDKTDDQIEPVNNSIVNRIKTLYDEKDFVIKFEDRHRFDYRILMNDPEIEIDTNVLLQYSMAVSNAKLRVRKRECSNAPVINDIISEMQKLDYAQYEICDMLIKDMFKDHFVFKDSRCKEFLFQIYGDIIYENIVINKPKYGLVCIDCGAVLDHNRGKRCRCAKCQKIFRTKYNAEIKRKSRACQQVQNGNFPRNIAI